jgi:hypothetical protein
MGKYIKMRFHHVVQVVHAKNFPKCDSGNVKVLKIRRIYFNMTIIKLDYQPFQRRWGANFVQAYRMKGKIQSFDDGATTEKCIHRRHFHATNVNKQHL